MGRIVVRVGLVAAVLAAASAGAGSPPAAADEPLAERVVVVGVAGLLWSDVDPEVTPNLAQMADSGSVGTLSVRSAPAVTCPAEGWLTLGSGTYAAVRDPADIDPDEGCAARPVPPVERRGEGGRVPDLTELNDDLRFGAEPGWLAEQVSCVAAVGPGAAPAAANSHGEVAHYAPTLPADFDQFAERCPATLIDAGTLPDGAEDPALPGGPASGDASAPPEPTGRVPALRRLDELLGLVRDATGPDTVVMVVGVAETEATQARLHVAIATGPGFGYGWLDSHSTRRVPYVQLADVAPTMLDALGVEFQDTAAGRPVTGARDGRPRTLDETRRVLADTDVRAVAQRHVLGRFFLGLVLVIVLLVGGLTWLVRRHTAGGAATTGQTGLLTHPRDPDATAEAETFRLLRRKSLRDLDAWARAIRLLRGATVGLSAVPAATFLANVVPWWRSPLPLVAIGGAVAVSSLVIVSLAVVVSIPVHGAERKVRAQIATVAAISLGVVALDAMTGARLQIDSLLGYNPLVAGRFYGFGNIAFAVLGAAGLILAAFAAHGRARGAALAAVALVGAGVLALDGLPQWGADFGGVLTLVPAFAVLAMLMTETAITWTRLLLAALSGAVLVGAIGSLDYLRPEQTRSHFGRFVGTVLDGSALHTIERKLSASLELLVMGPHTLAALILAMALTVAVFRPPTLLARAYDSHGVLRPLLYATVALAGFGMATNDSGIAIPAVVALMTGPATLAMCATSPLRNRDI